MSGSFNSMLKPTRLLCPWDLPGKDTGVGCHFLLQGVFPNQGSNPHLLNCRWIPYHWPTWGAQFAYYCVLNNDRMNLSLLLKEWTIWLLSLLYFLMYILSIRYILVKLSLEIFYCFATLLLFMCRSSLVPKDMSLDQINKNSRNKQKQETLAKAFSTL